MISPQVSCIFNRPSFISFLKRGKILGPDAPSKYPSGGRMCVPSTSYCGWPHTASFGLLIRHSDQRTINDLVKTINIQILSLKCNTGNIQNQKRRTSCFDIIAKKPATPFNIFPFRPFERNKMAPLKFTTTDFKCLKRLKWLKFKKI